MFSRIGKGQLHAQSEIKSRKRRRIIAPAKLIKHNQNGKDMTLIDPSMDGVFSSELVYINIYIWLYNFM